MSKKKIFAYIYTTRQFSREDQNKNQISKKNIIPTVNVNVSLLILLYILVVITKNILIEVNKLKLNNGFLNIFT
jgi:hypothetical protein